LFLIGTAVDSPMAEMKDGEIGKVSREIGPISSHVLAQ
jgi:hypothetical protein